MDQVDILISHEKPSHVQGKLLSRKWEMQIKIGVDRTENINTNNRRLLNQQ